MSNQTYPTIHLEIPSPFVVGCITAFLLAFDCATDSPCILHGTMLLVCWQSLLDSCGETAQCWSLWLLVQVHRKTQFSTSQQMGCMDSESRYRPSYPSPYLSMFSTTSIRLESPSSSTYSSSSIVYSTTCLGSTTFGVGCCCLMKSKNPACFS